jgi:hypothetical protein
VQRLKVLAVVLFGGASLVYAGTAGAAQPTLPPGASFQFAAHAAPRLAAPPAPCPALVVTNTTLKSDCLGPIRIGADGVHLNLAGHTVTCAGDLTRTGIVINGHTNDAVTNGTVSGCGTGIFVGGGGGNSLTNLAFVNNKCCAPAITPPDAGFNFGEGIDLNHSTGNALRAIGGTQNGIVVFLENGANNNRLEAGNFSLSGPFSNIEISSSNGNVVRSLTSTSAIFEGLLFSNGAASNSVQGSNMSGNLDGIGVGDFGGADNSVQANLANGNSRFGIVLYNGAVRTSVKANQTESNRVGILAAFGATANAITENTSLLNSLFDLADANPNCDANLWLNNNFVTTNQPQCVH